jgi:hypothetical protein
MNLEPGAVGGEGLVVFACRGDQKERLEMAMVMRRLASAIEDDRYSGCAHLVMEARWLERLAVEMDTRRQAASRG